MNSIFERTSDRVYTDQPITPEQRELILKAAFSYPSCRNAQPLNLIVVTDKDQLEKLSHVSPYARAIANSQVGVVLCADMDKNPALAYDIQDLAAATENMLVEAQDLGLSSCWIGGYPSEGREEFLADVLKTPAHIRPLWTVAFGYPEHKAAVKDKWDPEKIFYNEYGNHDESAKN